MDFSKLIREANIEHAIKGEVKTKLSDILQLFSKASLLTVAKNYELSGRSKMNKQELVDSLFETVTDVSELESVLIITEEKGWDLFQSLVNTPYVQEETFNPGMYLFLLERSLLFSFYYEDKLYYTIPEEIKETYKQLLQGTFLEARDRYQLINQYVTASSNLYGACKLDKVVEIFNAQNEKQLDQKEFIHFYSMASSKHQQWYLYQGYIFSNDFESDDQDEDLEAHLERTKHKPYYTPPKAEFLKHADSGYYRKTAQLDNLKAFILKNMCKDKQLVEVLMDDIQLVCSMERPMSDVINELERRNIIFDNQGQVQAIMPLIIDVYNNTRIWSNNGYTPAELGAISGKTTPKFSPAIPKFSTATPKPSKIGRNDPCTCGSGKKYKKCCGQ
ncbi:YecA family protein [Cohnella abietis]|uniref:Rho termination factor N-terminal domain-containing protein n=1 Tax=Cohnella abietis TaxID=2507935 RepID=A0A3T1CZH9_9BACL|nr:SEC-C metal-binding domain-containing protein [Cohnella abietis]BBI31228.1 hypothetical protein KCTCHS21_06270 [Cohnella abietis]